jgi:hypothetical protein
VGYSERERSTAEKRKTEGTYQVLIPGWIISILTFPGVIVHEFAHQLFCRLFDVRVIKVCYFRFGNPAGYVVHETPRNPMHSIWISIGPFLVNTIAGALIALPGSTQVLRHKSGAPPDFILIWLGVSIAMHSFPSTGDAKSIWRALWSRDASIIARVIGTPIVVLIYLGALGSFLWLDLIYGIAVVVIIPVAVIRLMT